jgi:outer membrane protein OmpA-like peptidoglycan-associated protein
MYRSTFFLLIFALLLLPQSFARASDPLDISGVLKNRKVIGVIYFPKDSVKLSKTHRAEIDKIAALAVAQYSSDKIVRVEGFTSKRAQQADPFAASLARAKAVWYYLEKMDPFKSGNLYLTGFNAHQSISKLQGERVEIVIYENPFKEATRVYSRN